MYVCIYIYICVKPYSPRPGPEGPDRDDPRLSGPGRSSVLIASRRSHLRPEAEQITDDGQTTPIYVSRYVLLYAQ